MSLSLHHGRLLAVGCIAFGVLCGALFGPKLVGQPAAPVPLPPGNPPALPREWMSYAPVVKRSLPAVVCIEGKAKAAKPQLDDPGPGFGSGVLIDPSGIVLTNNHVVADSTTVEVTLHDGRKIASGDIRRDPKSDLAIIKLDAKEPLPFVEFGDSNLMEVGDRVLALGAPFGLTGSVTQGIVSAKSRRNLNLNQFEDFIQIDAAVNPGNSGGPLVNMEGKVIGLTSAIKTRSGGFQGVGLAVSSNLAKDVVAQLIRHGAVRRPHLGVVVRDLDEATAAKQKVKPNSGVLVTEVQDNSPGMRANIGVGDIISRMNGQPVTTPRELQQAIQTAPVGQKLEVLVTRNGVLFLTHATLVEQAEQVGVEERVAPRKAIDFRSLGIAVTDLMPDAAARLGLPRGVKGVVVAGIAPNGLAERSGVVRGMLIVQVDRTPVATAEQFQQAVEQASREKGAVLHVLRTTGDIDFVILRGE
jgi:serine protease Do